MEHSKKRHLVVQYIMEEMEYTETNEEVCFNCSNSEEDEQGELVCSYNPSCKFRVGITATCNKFKSNELKLR